MTVNSAEAENSGLKYRKCSVCGCREYVITSLSDTLTQADESYYT